MKTNIEARACECEIQWEHWSKWDTVVDRPWFSRFASPPPPSHTHTTTLLESNTTTLLECNTWSCQGSSADKRAVGSLGGAWLRESKIGRKSETAGGPSLREVPILLARHLLYFFHFCILSAKHHFFSFISSFDFLFQYCRPDTVYILSSANIVSLIPWAQEITAQSLAGWYHMRGEGRQEVDSFPILIYSFGRFRYSQNHFSLDKISSTTFLSYTFYREEKATQFTWWLAVVQFSF